MIRAGLRALTYQIEPKLLQRVLRLLLQARMLFRMTLSAVEHRENHETKNTRHRRTQPTNNSGMQLMHHKCAAVWSCLKFPSNSNGKLAFKHGLQKRFTKRPLAIPSETICETFVY